MTTPQHTADKWTACFSRVKGVVTDFRIAGQQFGSIFPIAECPERHKFSPAELEANANIIAAAPDLLAALSGLVGFLTDYPHPYHEDISGFLEEAEAAIAKAKGEG